MSLKLQRAPRPHVAGLGGVCWPDSAALPAPATASVAIEAPASGVATDAVVEAPHPNVGQSMLQLAL